MNSNINNEHEEISLNNNLTCRICFENDNENNLLHPCKCSGGYKYVHKQCLNEWRTMSPNSENYNRCEVCHYNYKITSKPTFQIQIFKNIIKNFFGFIVFSYVIMYILGYCIISIDKSNQLLNDFHICTYKGNHTVFLNNKKTGVYNCNGIIEKKNYFIFYSLVSGVILFGISLIYVIFSVIPIKNKKLYCSFFFSKLKFALTFVVFFLLFFLIDFINFFICMTFTQFCCLYILHTHFTTVIQINSSNQSFIENYEEVEEMEEMGEDVFLS